MPMTSASTFAERPTVAERVTGMDCGGRAVSPRDVVDRLDGLRADAAGLMPGPYGLHRSGR